MTDPGLSDVVQPNLPAGGIKHSVGGRLPRVLLLAISLGLLVLALAVLVTAQARIPFVLHVAGTHATLAVDGQTLQSSWPRGTTHVGLQGQDPNLRLFQIDGTDISGTNSYNPDTFQSIAGTPYVRFLCWLRDCSSYTQWQDLSVRDDATGQILLSQGSIELAQRIVLPSHFTLTGSLERPDLNGNLFFTGSTTVQIAIAPDARTILLNGSSHFYPYDVLPYAAEVGWTLTRVYIWGFLLILFMVALGLLVALSFTSLKVALPSAVRAIPSRLAQVSRSLWHPRSFFLAAVLILAGLLAISTFEYQQLPRIFDATAYYFQAKIMASGNLWAPTPPDSESLHFLGAFMVSMHGHWFAHYSPGAPLMLAIGVLAHLPWAVEPLLGAASVVLMARLAYRWYELPTALLTLPLVGLSPFFLFLASSFMSHMIVLFALLLFLEGIDQLASTGNWRWGTLAGAGLGFAFLTRELDTVLFAAVVFIFYAVRVIPTIWATLDARRRSWRNVSWMTFCLVTPLALCLAFYVFYNWRTTGDLFLTPRAALDPKDTWGFGNGKGWYGQHTVAAGLFNAEDLLTSLLIHLFGWPYYLTLAFFAIPLVTLRLKAHDVLLYGIAASFIVGYIGLYYHGIAFGPRYLLGSLPAYILLTARGIVEATSLIGLLLRRIVVPARARVGGIISVGSTLAALISCNLFFYLPHQFPLYYDYLAPHVTGGLAYDRIHPSWMHQAIVFSNDGDLYGNVLFPLNDPQLQGDILYARVIETHNIHSLLVSYPHRALYWAEIFQQELRFSPMNILSASLHQISPVLDKSVPLAGPGFSDLAMDRHGDFFLANSNDGTILHFDPAGRQLGVITTGLPPGSLFRITVFHDSVCWVDSEAGMLWCADIAGQHRHRMLQKPCSACADFTQGPQGDLIAAATSNGMLLRFTSQGVLIATTHAQAGLKQPTSVATTADGRIFTYDVERRQTIEFDRLLQHPKILPFGSDANGSITRLSAFGNWVVALDPATQALVAYNAQTGVIHTVSVSSTGDILPVQGYGLFWNGRQLAFASGFPGVIDVLTTGTVPF